MFVLFYISYKFFNGAFLQLQITGKVLPKKRAFITDISKELLPEAKIFPFFKLTNFFGKGKNFCDYFHKTFKELLQPRFFGNTMLSTAIFYYFFTICMKFQKVLKNVYLLLQICIALFL